jgi:hypothetical protein
MGKAGLLVLAVGLAVAYYAHKKSKQQHALTAPVNSAAKPSSSHQVSSYQPPPQASSTKLRDASTIFTHLVRAVRAKHLESFYPPSSTSELNVIANNIARTGTLEILAVRPSPHLFISLDAAADRMGSARAFCFGPGSACLVRPRHLGRRLWFHEHGTEPGRVDEDR